jgi:hypothetical protein
MFKAQHRAAQLLLFFFVASCVASLENKLNDASAKDQLNATSSSPWTVGTISSNKDFQHYFRLEFELLTSQSMILGDYHPNDEESRLRLQLKALQLELAYTKNLRRMILDPVGSSNINRNVLNTSGISGSQANAATCDDSENRRKQGLVREILHKINKTINQATWYLWADPPSEVGLPFKMQVHHGYDFDWIDENGSFGLYDELNCYDHAQVQKKRLYTDDDWNSLWHKFQDASLYPFPIPTPSKRPYYTAYSEGKGRGNFASRNIEKGELIYDGYSNAAFFQVGESFKRFVALLSKEAACDVIEWAFMQDLTNTGSVVLALDMDGGGFFNDGSTQSNMENKKKSSLDKYAIKDIQKGEEITENYEDFPKNEIDL